MTTPSSPRARRALIAVFTAVAMSGLGFGTSMPLLSFLLESKGVSGSLIGLNTAMTALAALAITPFVPRALSRFGAARVLIMCLVVIAAMLVAMRAYIDVWAWFPLRFVFGAALAVMFTSSEYWINSAADSTNRGRLIGLYAMIFSAGWAVGPMLLQVLGIETWAPVIATCVLLALAAVPLSLVRNAAPMPEHHARLGLLQVITRAPIATFAAFVYGGVEIGVFTLIPVYALRSGLSEETGTTMLTALALGNVALQYPIGWLADRFDHRLILIACGLAGLGGALSLGWVAHTPMLLYPTLFLWGGIVVGLYAVGLVMLGERFRGGELAAANAAFVLLYSIGGLVTPPVSGYAMDLWRPHGLALVLGLICGAYVLAAVWVFARRGPAPQATP